MDKKSLWYMEMSKEYYKEAETARKNGKPYHRAMCLHFLFFSKAIFGDTPLSKLCNPQQIVQDEPFVSQFNNFLSSQGATLKKQDNYEICRTLFFHMKCSEQTSLPVRFIIPKALVDGFLNTGLEGTTTTDIMFPYNAFIIDLPPHAITVLGYDNETYEAQYIIVASNVPSIVGESLSCYVQFFPTSTDCSLLCFPVVTIDLPLIYGYTWEKIACLTSGACPHTIHSPNSLDNQEFKKYVDLEQALILGELRTALVNNYISTNLPEEHMTEEELYELTIKVNSYLEEVEASAKHINTKAGLHSYLSGVLPEWALNEYRRPEASVFGNKLEGPDFRQAILRIAVNTILYINSPGASITHIHQEEITVLKKSTKKKGKALAAAKTKKKIAKLEEEPAWFLATDLVLNLDKINNSQSQNTGNGTPLSHATIVRGHWARQPYGPKSSLRKLIWRKPYIRGKHLGDPIAGHNYDVRI